MRSDKQTVQQAIRNLPALLALVFARKFLEPGALARAAFCYVLLCGASELLLVVKRRLRAGNWGGLRVEVGSWSWGERAVRLGPLVLSLVLGWRFAVGMVALVALGLLQDRVLRRIVLLDVIGLGVEFSLKAALGGWALAVRISPWLLLCTFLLALLVGLGKRRNELAGAPSAGQAGREVLEEYTPQLLNQLLAVVTSSTFIAFALYTVSPDRPSSAPLYFTLPMVLYGILRYLYLVHRSDMRQGSEIAILEDRASMVNIVLWSLVTLALLWPRG
jgi:hypothetical protein